MPGNRRYLPLGAVHEDGMGAAFAKKLTAVLLEMTKPIGALHAESRKRSLMTVEFARSSSAKSLFA